MQDISRVDVLECAENLVHDVLAVVVREHIRGRADVVQVRVHQIRHNVDRLERVAILDNHKITDPDNVLVVKVREQPQLAKRPLGVNEVLKHVLDFLDGKGLACRAIRRLAHAAKGAFTQKNRVLQRVLGVDVEPHTTDHVRVLGRRPSCLHD
eukprot:Amastigsp_a509387_154.p3 type:complete len:153 gc:universal Amastigsp_a509387_154:884-1342(+)